MPAADPEAVRNLATDALFFPPTYPPVTAAVLGEDGTVWLRGAVGDQGHIDWMVMGERGQIVGIVNLHGSLTILVATREMIWGVQYDATGVPFIRRLRIEASD